MKGIVFSSEIPGLLAILGGEPVGWCAIAPRQAFPRLAKSRILKPVDHQPVWSIVCFYIARAHRRQGITQGLITAALEFARQGSAKMMEAYPVEPKAHNAPAVFLYTGIASAFAKAGFTEAARHSKDRPIMRYNL